MLTNPSFRKLIPNSFRQRSSIRLFSSMIRPWSWNSSHWFRSRPSMQCPASVHVRLTSHKLLFDRVKILCFLVIMNVTAGHVLHSSTRSSYFRISYWEEFRLIFGFEIVRVGISKETVVTLSLPELAFWGCILSRCSILCFRRFNSWWAVLFTPLLKSHNSNDSTLYWHACYYIRHLFHRV